MKIQKRLDEITDDLRDEALLRDDYQEHADEHHRRIQRLQDEQTKLLNIIEGGRGLEIP